jgi:hypothetical protein
VCFYLFSYSNLFPCHKLKNKTDEVSSGNCAVKRKVFSINKLTSTHIFLKDQHGKRICTKKCAFAAPAP